MIAGLYKNGLLLGIGLLVLAGCGGAPYVYIEGEFNRQSDYYLNGAENEDAVTVCYSKRRTTPTEVSRLAVAQCKRFGKRAVFSKTSYSQCPLTTPAAAIYDCRAGS